MSLGRLSMVCKNFNIITYDSSLWKYVIRNWQNEVLYKMKKTKYAKNPSSNIMLLLEPPIILDQEGEIVVRSTPQINGTVYPSSRNSLRRFQPINGQFINQNNTNNNGVNYHLNNRNIQTPPPPQLHPPQYNQINHNTNAPNNNLNTNTNVNNNTVNNILTNTKSIKNQEPNSKLYYIESFIKIKTQLSDRMDLIKKQKKQEKRMKSINRSTKVMFFTFFSRPCEWLSVALLILFTIFIGLKLDNYIDWSWPIIFLPLLFVTLQCICSPLIFVFFRTLYNHQYEEELSPDSCIKPLFFSLFFILPLQPSEKLYKVLLFTPILSIIMFIVLLVCKLTLENFAMIYVFIPIFVLSVYLIAFTLCFPERIDYSLEWLDQFSMTICSLLFFVFNILLFLKVDEAVNLKWIYVFSPLFVIKAIAMIYPCIIRIMYHTSLEWWLDQKTGWFREPGSLTLVIVFFVLVSCPLIAFETMLIQNLSSATAYKYSLVLIPIYFMEFLSICGCFFINVAFSSNSE
ncbi:hypothetical protein DICPUDRAFT_50074 [Dictyostelium purpureum]|uniref:F-box domain-containing protein n=1 Tax=Dictyostelium purpureum TaxID=5786 RepID=F0ZWP1_DICPU|nr:uncharacterized protein DICPUDRAFT_50074 [Dictyostelium purpureum]EGC31634.1 hypothetical protein DICPUDRAFT_50074 [Dictyostelium purpureum]|eukprot:XP_003291832.1 hypothetical protein DICPUDRAFT_50074 [Dictyostelium purpureum]